MDNPRTTPPGGGEELERAGSPARSIIGVDSETEAREYLAADREETARINEFNRIEFRKKLFHFIRSCFIVTFACIGWISAVALAGTALFVALLLIVIVVAHYLIPQWDWLKPEQLTVLGNWYAKSASFIAPVALITNAWLVAYISIKRPRATTTDGTRDQRRLG